MKSLKHILFYSGIFCLFPLTLSTTTFAANSLFFVTLFGSGILGSALLSRWFDEEDHLNALVFVLLGPVVLQCIASLHFIIFPTVIILSTAYGIFHLLKQWNTTRFSLNIDIVCLLLISLAFLYIGKDFREAASFFVIHPTNDDNYYFSAITESISKGSYWNSFLDSGAPLNYQIISFLLPANFAEFSKVSGHLSFWGFSMPYYKLISILLFAFAIKQLLYIRALKFRFILSASALLLLTFSALNVVNFLKLKWSGLVFFASGNFWPGGNPGITLGFSLITLGMFLLLRSYNNRNLILAGSCSIMIMLTKIAMWYPFAAFMGVYVLLHGFTKNNMKKLSIVVSTGIISFILYTVYYTSFSAAKFKIEPFEELKNMISRTFRLDGSTVFQLLLFFGGYIVLSFGIRLILLALPFFKRADNEMRKISIATIASVFLSALLLIPFKIYFYDLEGNIVYDSSYNLEQFLRSSFILVMFSSVLLLFFYLKKLPEKARKLLALTVVVYCSLIAYGNYTFYSKASASLQEIANPWRANVRNYFMKHQSSDQLLCMIGNSENYKAHDLAADGIGPWWYSGKTNDGSHAYFFSVKNRNRSMIVDSVMRSDSIVTDLHLLKKEGVSHLIISPVFKSRIDSVAFLSGLNPTESSFVYIFGNK